MLYCYECPECDYKVEEVKASKDSNDFPTCPTCGVSTRHDYASKLAVGVVPDGELVTDFGDGPGEKAYSRREYLDECKRLDRDPVGMLWK